MPPQSPVVASRRLSLEQGTVWALVATLVLAFLIVIPWSTFPLLPTKSFVLAAGALVTLAVYIIARLARGNLIIPPPMLLLALWLPTLAYAFSTVFAGGSSFAATFWGSALQSDSLGFMLTLSLLGTLAALAMRRPEQYRLFFRATTWLFGAVALSTALIIIVGQMAPNLVSPAFSIVGSNKDLAAILGFGVIAILLAIRSLELSARTGRALLAVGVVALALLAVLNVSLIWVLIALVALGLFVEAVMMRRSQVIVEVDFDDAALLVEDTSADTSGARPFLVPLVVLAVSLFFIIGATLGGALASALKVSGVDVRPSWQSTLDVGRQVYSSSPVFGSGPGTFGVEWLKHRDASLNSTVFWNIDFASGIGFVPTSFVTTGTLGALAWIALLLLVLFYGLRTLILRAPEDPFIQYASTATFVGTLFFLIIAVLDMSGPITLAIAFVSLGIFASTMRYARGGRQWGIVFAHAPRLGFVVVFGLTLLLLGAVGAAYALIERYVATVEFARASTAYAAGELTQAEAAANASLKFAPLPSAYTLQALIAGAKLSQIINSTSLPPSEAQKAFQDTLSAGINAALTATRLAPSDYQGWTALGNLYGSVVPLGVLGAYESAKAAYDKAIALNPTNPQLYFILAQLEIAHKDSPAAQAALKQAIALKNDYTGAIFLVSQLEVADGNLKDALSSAEAAAYFTPNDPNVLFQVGILRAAANDLQGASTALAASVAANPSFANARYFLAAVYARQKNYQSALEQIEAVAALSNDNAAAVESVRATLAAGNDPFPANLLSIAPAPTATPPASGTP